MSKKPEHDEEITLRQAWEDEHKGRMELLDIATGVKRAPAKAKSEPKGRRRKPQRPEKDKPTLVELILYGELTLSTGIGLMAILRAIGVHSTTFHKTPKYEKARLTWESVQGARQENKLRAQSRAVSRDMAYGGSTHGDGESAPEDCRNGGKNSLPVRVGHKVHAVKDDDTYQDGVCVEASEAGCWVRTEDGVLFGTPWKNVMAYASQ